MLRCGQMVVAEALIRCANCKHFFPFFLVPSEFFVIFLYYPLLNSTTFRHHLGADWRWSEDCNDEKYLNIVKLFEDRKAAVYSIHQVS